MKKKKTESKKQKSSSSAKLRLSILSASLVALVGGGFAYYKFIFPNRTVRTVGDYKITMKEKVLRDQLHRIYYPKETKDYGLDQLTRAYTYAQILKNNGMEVTENIIRNEEMRINQNSKAPDVLRKIRGLFKGDEEAYKKVFILPTYVERTIYYDFFSKSMVTQKKSLEKVQNFLRQLKETQSDFEGFARQENLKVARLLLSAKDGLQWVEEKKPKQNKAKEMALPPGAPKSVVADEVPADLKNQLDQESSGQSLETAVYWVENIIPRMKLGEVLGEPVDFEGHWLLVQYEKALPKKKYQLRVVFFPKDDYNEWLESEKAKIPVK